MCPQPLSARRLVDRPGTDVPLSELEREAIAFFVELADAAGIPRSVGEIYGLLFISPSPLTMNELTSRLRLSKGSVSQGLRRLRSFDAVRTVYVPSDRRAHFEPETELEPLVGGLIRETIEPRVNLGRTRIAQLARLSKTLSSSGSEELSRRIDHLEVWRARGEKLLPLIREAIGSADG